MTWPCPRCKVAQVVTAMYCASCGEALGAAPEATALRPTVTAKKKGFLNGWLGAFILLGITLVVVYAVLGARKPTPTAPALSDAAMKAAMVENINEFPASTVAIRRETTGVPDIAVKDAVLIVVTMNPTPNAAESLCRMVAAITNSGVTGMPLGIVSVVIISGGQRLVACRP